MLNGKTNSEDKGNFLFTIAVSFVAAVGGLLFGFDTGVISGAIPFITEHFQLNVVQTGFAVSNLIIACMFGAVFAGPLTDRFGRKKILILSAFFYTVSAVFSALPQTFTQLVIARFIGGLGVGSSSVLSPLYIAEIAPARMRGRLVAINQLAIVIGILISYFSDWLLVGIGPNNWRWMFGVGIVPSILFMIILFLIPESPRWLVQRGFVEKARRILAKVGGKTHADMEINEIQAALLQEHASYKDLLRPGLRKAMFVGLWSAVLCQITGINIIIYYGTTIFMKAGFQSNSSAIFGSVLIGSINFIFTLVGISLIDKLGRKALMVYGYGGMGISMICVGLLHNSAQFIVIPVLAYCASFALSVGVVIWVYLSEIYPTKLRGRAMAIATMTIWFSNVVVSQVFPWMLDNMKQYSFYVFAVICVIALVFTKSVVFETKNKSLEEIEKEWMV